MADARNRSSSKSRFAGSTIKAMCVGAIAFGPLGCGKPAQTAKGPPPASAGTAPSQPTPAKVFVPDDPELIAENNKGVGLMGRFEYEPAREVFAGLVGKHPDWLDAKVNLAIATLNRQREGDESAALGMLTDVLKVDGNNLRAHYCTGLLKLYLESPEEALPHFRKVAEDDPADAYAAYYAGQCFAQMRDYESALSFYQRSLANDPYVRSAYFASSQALRALGRDEEARAMVDQFTRLEPNPRAHLVDFLYSRMGPKGEALAVGLHDLQDAPMPGGPAFLEPVRMLENGDAFGWKEPPVNRMTSITVCDVDGDQDLDVFFADALSGDLASNAVCLNDGNNVFRVQVDHPLSPVRDVSAALWGDFDNDGLTDVYFCRRGPNMLWRQKAPNTWENVTETAGVDNGKQDTVDGAMVDFDHDGDLDIFCVNDGGPTELFINNRDGTFRPIAAERGIQGPKQGSRLVLACDVDTDRDLDVLVLNRDLPNGAFINDRMWDYHVAPDELMRPLATTGFQGVLACDRDADGRTEILSYMHTGIVNLWHPNEAGLWDSHEEYNPKQGVMARMAFSLSDLDGDGRTDIVANVEGELRAFTMQEPPRDLFTLPNAGGKNHDPFGWTLANLVPGRGPSLIVLPMDGQPIVLHPGSGRQDFAAVSFSGREVVDSDGRQVRSNASGIGTHFMARIGSRWVAGHTLRNSSAPGQSLQPVAIGLAGASSRSIDFLQMDWSDGLFQSEMALGANEVHRIVETQRQISSCPVLFAWNGHRFEFVTDLLGVGGIGYAVGPREYAPSRPWERLLLPEGSIVARNGRFMLKLSEPMEEACYLDAARLVAYDLPPGVKATIDDRMSIQGPEPTGEVRLYRREFLPSNAENDRGEDVLELVARRDLQAAPVGELDERFIGRLKQDHVLTLDFAQAIHAEAAAAGEQPMLVIDGWIEYPYSQTMFAAWQAAAAYRAPSVEARGEDGQWVKILDQFGYPAGMPRQMSVPLPVESLPKGTRQVRLSTNQEIFWDRIAIAYAETGEAVAGHQLPLVRAQLNRTGFALRTTGPQRQPYYDYDQRAPLWDTRHQRGWYTLFGEMSELVANADDALAVFGPGEEVHLEYADDLPPLQSGWTRVFVLEADGWCKDMDLFTGDGETINPMPQSGPGSTVREQLHERFNRRFESGR